MYVEVLDHARHDGGGLGRAIGFSRQDSVSHSRHGLVTEHVFLVGSYSDCLLKMSHFVGSENVVYFQDNYHQSRLRGVVL